MSRAKERHKALDADVLGVLSAPQGRRFVWRLLTQAGLHSSSYVQSPTATAYNEGRRSIALNLMRECQRVAPELWVRMVHEASVALVTEDAPPQTPQE